MLNQQALQNVSTKNASVIDNAGNNSQMVFDNKTFSPLSHRRQPQTKNSFSTGTHIGMTRNARSNEQLDTSMSQGGSQTPS